MEQAMNAATQYKLGAADLDVVLALVRGATLAAAGERLAVDASTVFRALQRIERGLRQPLFERSRTGYLPTELALALAAHAEQVEAALEQARGAAQLDCDRAQGSVRITTTDSVLHGLVAPALATLAAEHPALHFEIDTANALANLTRRDADIAVRATKRPPEHLVGKRIGTLRLALYAARKGPVKRLADVEAGRAAWIGVDDALPEHPSVAWRRRHFPKAQPRWRVDSIVTAQELVSRGFGVALLPAFYAARLPGLRALTEVLDETSNELWLLAHRESRHLRRVSTVFAHLARELHLD
jgi:DNA-binding transcriptional LysR family regulator